MRPVRFLLVLLLLLMGLTLIGSAPVSAQDPGSAEQELAEKWAPLIQIRAQEDECDSTGEAWEPTNVDIVLDNPEVVLRDVDDEIVVEGPTAADLFGLEEGYYLDFPGRSLSPGCTYEKDFQRFKADSGTPPTIYAHVVSQADEPGLLAVQYWFYWYFNEWNNTHESDWEGIHILFEADSAEEALGQDPIAVGYAQHSGGEKAKWTDSDVAKVDGRLVVYPSAGSHATYYANALYLGRSASEGFGCDNTQTPSETLDSEVVLLPDEVTSASDPFAWLAFEGRWGEKHRGAFDGPTGPTAKDRWLNPIDWHEDLRDSSVVIPGDSALGTSVTSSFCSVVEAGSTVLLWFLATPWLAFGLLVLIGIAIVWALRSTTWSPVTTEPLVARRAGGQRLKAAARRYRSGFGMFIVIGLIFVPVAVLVAVGQSLLLSLPGLRHAGDLFGGRSGPLLNVLALMIGGLGNTIAFILVSAAVAGVITRGLKGGKGAAGEAWAAVMPKAGDLLWSAIKALFFIVLLAISIVGLPWAIRNAILWVFIPEEVMINGADHRSALKASRSRVQGAWWRTAAFAVVVSGVATIAGPIVGLPLLLFTGIPVLIVNLIGALVFTLVVPYAAAAMIYLWGDRMAATAVESDPEEVRTG